MEIYNYFSLILRLTADAVRPNYSYGKTNAGWFAKKSFVAGAGSAKPPLPSLPLGVHMIPLARRHEYFTVLVDRLRGLGPELPKARSRNCPAGLRIRRPVPNRMLQTQKPAECVTAST